MVKELKVNLLPAKTFRYLRVNDVKMDLSGVELIKSKSRLGRKTI